MSTLEVAGSKKRTSGHKGKGKLAESVKEKKQEENLELDEEPS